MTTYYVDGAVGSDSSSNDGLSEGAGNAWATIDHAMNNVIGGDIVYVKATGTYSETPNIDTAGGLTTPIIFEGYTSTPGDNGKATISGTTNCLTCTPTGGVFYIFSNFIFTGASGNGVSMFGSDACSMYNCEFTSNGGAGVLTGNSWFFTNCEIKNNTGDGARIEASNNFFGCIFSGNSGYAIDDNDVNFIYKCVFYDNTLGGIDSDAFQIFHSTFDGDNVGGSFASGNTNQFRLIDNIFYDSAAYAVQTTNTPIDPYCVIGYNIVNSNASGNYNFSAYNIGYQDVTEAPEFVDEANDDYTLSGYSPAIAKGMKPGCIT